MIDRNPLDETQNPKSSCVTINPNDYFVDSKTQTLKKCSSTIQNPPHYNNHPSGIECIQITRHMNFNLGNAIKYIWRADLKNDAIEDLKKAMWYIQDEIQRREKK
jgi:sugar/nucleoside kinase (ribokinase family)